MALTTNVTMTVELSEQDRELLRRLSESPRVVHPGMTVLNGGIIGHGIIRIEDNGEVETVVPEEEPDFVTLAEWRGYCNWCDFSTGGWASQEVARTEMSDHVLNVHPEAKERA